MQKEIIQKITEEYNSFQKQSVEYIKDRSEVLSDFDLENDVVKDDEALEILEAVDPEWDRENTIREQAYLRWLEEAMSIVNLYFNNQNKEWN